MLVVVTAVFCAALRRRPEPARPSACWPPASSGRASAPTVFQHVQTACRQFLHPDKGDHYQVNHGAGSVRQWRAVRARAGRGPCQGRAAGRARGFRVRRRGRGIRPVRLPGHHRRVRLHRAARPAAAAAGGRPVRACWPPPGWWPVSACRRSSTWPPRCADPDQGHDAAVHFLWRLLGDGDRLRHRPAAGADAPPAGRGDCGEGPRRAPHRDRGRRHRRAFLSRRGAGRRTGGARRSAWR